MKRFLLFTLLCAFALPLVSWKSYKGIRIEKRRYRKGYYVHVWKTGKTEPQHTGVAVQSTGGGNQSAGRDGFETKTISIGVPPPVPQSTAPVARQADHPPSSAVDVNVAPTRSIPPANLPKAKD